MADEKNPKSVFEQIDLSKVSLQDLMTLKNSSVRDALVEMVRNPDSIAASGHQNHGSHENHNTDSSKFLETEFVQDLIKKAVPRK